MKLSNILWGLVLILIGIIFGLNALDIADINIFFDGWWTLFIIVPCFIDLFKDRDKSGNIIGLIIGICLLLGCQNLIDFDLIWKLMLPFILIMIGLSFIFKDVFKNKNNKVLNKKGMKEYCATFGGQKVNYAKEKFGASVTFIQPDWVKPEDQSEFEEDCATIEKLYFKWIDKGYPAQLSRYFLINGTKTELVITGFADDWQHFFDLRALDKTGPAHPDIKKLALPLYQEFLKLDIIEEKQQKEEETKES